jgi:hypothetical protein
VVLQGSPHYYGPHRFKFAPEHPISIDLPDWVREGAQVYLPAGQDTRIAADRPGSGVDSINRGGGRSDPDPVRSRRRASNVHGPTASSGRRQG